MKRKMLPIRVHKPENFYVKKWILVSSICVNIVYIGLVVYYSDNIVTHGMEHFAKHLNDKERNYYQQIFTTSLIFACANLVLLEVTMMLGIIREIKCLSITYTAKAFLSTLVVLIFATIHSVFLVHSLWAGFITMIATIYVHDLKAIETRRKLSVVNV